MKIFSTILAVFLCCNIYSQANGDSEKDYGRNQRIAFIIGAGASYAPTTLYDAPVIDRSTNNVIIDKLSPLRPNASLGIVFTPLVKTKNWKITARNTDGSLKKVNLLRYEPYGMTYALFINPIKLSDFSSGSTFRSTDIGLGIGWRNGNFAALATTEFFSINQPRDQFIKQHKDNNIPYVVGEEIQTSIDVNDNSIFKNKVAVAFGLKFCFTFDVAKQYFKQTAPVDSDALDKFDKEEELKEKQKKEEEKQKVKAEKKAKKLVEKNKEDGNK